MKVLHLDHSSQLGGGQLGLLRYLRQPSPFERALLILEDGPLAEQARRTSVPVEVQDTRGSKARLLLGFRGIARAVRSSEADMVVANSLRAAIVLAFIPLNGSAKIYYIREDMSPEQISGLKRWIVVNVVLRRFQGFLANSRWTATTLPPTLRDRPLRVAYPVSGITADDVEKASAHPRSPSSVPFVIGYLGRISEWKGVHVIIKAAHDLKRQRPDADFVVRIAGSPIFEKHSYFDAVKQEAANGPATIEFVGQIADVSEFLREVTVLVHASLRPEPFGQVIVQALGNGAPLIATRGGGPSEVLDEDRTGILVPPGDAISLTDALIRLIDNPEERETLSENGLRAATSFTDDATSAALDSALGTWMPTRHSVKDSR